MVQFNGNRTLHILQYYAISFRFGAPGVEFYGQLDKESVITHLYFIHGKVCVDILYL